MATPNNCRLSLHCSTEKCRPGWTSLSVLLTYVHRGTRTLWFLEVCCGGREGGGSGSNFSVSAWQQCGWLLSRPWTGQREFSYKAQRLDSIWGDYGERETIWLGWQEGLLLGKTETSFKGLSLVDPFHLKSGASLLTCRINIEMSPEGCCWMDTCE